MKISKNLEPIVSGISAALVISVLAFLSLETSAGIWLMFSFGATVFIVFVLHDLETAQPKNIFFGHLLTALIGVIFVNFIPLPIFITIPLAVGIGIFLMILMGVTHPPAGGNPIIVIIGSASFSYIINPIIIGTIIVLVFGIILNRLILNKEYPKKGFSI